MCFAAKEGHAEIVELLRVAKALRMAEAEAEGAGAAAADE